MCVTCGCSGAESVTITDPATGEQRVVSQAEHDHAHEHGTAHEHAHSAAPAVDHGHMHGNTQGHGHSHLHDHAHSHDHDHAHPHTHDHPHSHAHDHDHGHAHPHVHDDDHAHATSTLRSRAQATTIALEQNILAKNQLLAERNRGWLAGRDILALNLVSSPGSGKTMLLERTIRDLQDELVINVIEGDQATAHDAQRIRAAGAKAIQINTGTGCHLEAEMLARGLHALDPAAGSVVMIENVGNLVCPALFDLGERAKVVILSVTEGEDKPLKYPHMFKASEVMLLNKIDLLPHLRFDAERCIAYARQVNPGIRVYQVSAQTGEGMSAWYGWLRSQAEARQIAS